MNQDTVTALIRFNKDRTQLLNLLPSHGVPVELYTKTCNSDDKDRYAVALSLLKQLLAGEERKIKFRRAEFDYFFRLIFSVS